MTPYRPLRRVPRLARLVGWCLVAAGLAAAATGARAEEGAVTAKPRAYVTHFNAYAEVAPVTLLKLRAATAGVVSGLDLVPGQEVTTGTTLVRLTGPSVRAALASRQAAVDSAAAASIAAQKSLQVQRQKRGMHLATDEAVSQSQATAAETQAHLADAKAQLQTLQGEMQVQSPEAGQVVTVEVANGERVVPGQMLLTMQPAHDLWLKASFYGAAAGSIRPGMQGSFQPADDSPPVPVKVRSVLGVVQAGGAVVVGCSPIQPGAAWRNGETGSLVLQGKAGTLPAVPTRALILDQGRWWVVLHTASGDRRQAVQPGPVQGDDTLIRQGLSPGAQVVVENPYLVFHRNFAQQYQQPD